MVVDRTRKTEGMGTLPSLKRSTEAGKTDKANTKLTDFDKYRLGL